MAQTLGGMGGPHQGQAVLEAGARLGQAHAAMILVHGRGSSAADSMIWAAGLMHPGFAYLAPQAAGGAWYPHPFTAPVESNEPYLSSALELLASLLKSIEATIPAERVVLVGFSQGGCLTLEFAARHAREYGGVVGFSAGLIGPDGTPRDYPGDFAGTPTFLGCSDIDPHIPKARVVESGEVFKRLGAEVTVRLYPGMGHTVSADEITSVNEMIAPLAIP
jgi:predicted esterase